MQVIDDKTDSELLESLKVELAKASNELSCARKDLEKVSSRQKFLLMLAYKLIERQGDKK